MPAREILQLGNTTLWQKSLAVDDPSSLDTQSIIRDLSETLSGFREATGFGRGIAAPQIGALKRVIFINVQPAGFCAPLINPHIAWTGADQIELWDDCFSFPDLMVRVRRAAEVRVEYLDERGARRVIEARGGLSELLQHEIDHLDGVLAVQRAISPTAFSTRAQWERNLKRSAADAFE